MIKLEKITKQYGKTAAIDRVSLDITDNGIYCLLGRNGAGKTTLMKMLAGHIAPTEGTITVNGEVVNIPSYSLKLGDVVGVREKSKSLEVINDALSGGRSRYSWLEWDASSMSGKFLQRPDREDIPENIKEQLIVELYSK